MSTTESAQSPPLGTPWELLGADELGALQEQLELLPLLQLRAASNAVRNQLDAVAPPAVRLALWILDQKIALSVADDQDCSVAQAVGDSLDALAEAHSHMRDAACICAAPTRRLLDTYKLFQGMAREIRPHHPFGVRFRHRWREGLVEEICARVSAVIGGDGGNSKGTNYAHMSEAEHAAACGPPMPLTEDESVTLLADMFDPPTDGPLLNDAPVDVAYLNNGVHMTNSSFKWNPFITAAMGRKLVVLRYLASRCDVDPHWRDRNCNNAYAYVTRWIHEQLQWYEKDACEFPDPKIFDEVRPGETYARYMARRREELRTEYAPVLAYLADELGLHTHQWNGDSDEESED